MAVSTSAANLPFGQLLVEAVGDVADRLAEVEDRVEDQLFLAALGADDQVVAFAAAVERLVDHAVDDQHGHDQRHAQAHRHDRQRETRARCRMLRQATFQRLMMIGIRDWGLGISRLRFRRLRHAD